MQSITLAQSYSLRDFGISNSLNIYTDGKNDYINLLELSNILGYKSGVPYLKKHYRFSIVNRLFTTLPEVKNMLHNARKPHTIDILRILEEYSSVVIMPSPQKQYQVTNEIESEFKSLMFEHEYKCGRFKIDLYCQKKKVAIEIDENGHTDRDPEYEKNRENFIKKMLGCKIIRINPDERGFRICKMLQTLRCELV